MKLTTAKPFINNKICTDVVEVLNSGIIAQGPKVKKLEEDFSKYTNAPYCAAVNSGTAALHASLFAVGIKPGDEVITTPFTFVATANSILMVGAKPVFVDIDSKTFNLDPNKIKEKITPKTKAIIVVHLFGLISDMDQVLDIAKKHDLKIIEDACQAHGAKYNGIQAGNLGDIGAFSLYATKNMMSAEGGLVVSKNEEYIEKIKSFRHHGQSLDQRYNYTDFGYNYRMTDIHAVIGINQLEMLEKFNQKREGNAKLYNSGLEKIKGINTPFLPYGHRHVYHQYTIKIQSDKLGYSRDELIKELKKNDIYPGVFYPKSLHLFPTFKTFGYTEGDFPVTEQLTEKVLSLPVHPGISENDVVKVVSVIKNYSCQ